MPRPLARPSRRVVVASVVAAATLVVALSVALVPRPARATSHLPVIGPATDVFDGDIGDPFVLPVPAGPSSPAGYWIFGTGDWPARVPTGFSTDLRHWQRGPDAMPQLPAWAGPDPSNALTWAPSVLATRTGYLLYLTVPDATSGRECIAVEQSSRPQGPYVDTSNGPLVCQVALGGSIDPMVLRDGTGLHLLWKNDGNCCGITVSLWEQDVTPDGLHLAGAAHRLLSADQPWEDGVIERPVAVPASHGGWWLFHAGNSWQVAAYGTGVAWCSTLQGPCRDATQAPWLATHGQQSSPGGLDAFTDLHGSRWVVYAIWNRPARNGVFYCCRSVELAPLVSA